MRWRSILFSGLLPVALPLLGGSPLEQAGIEQGRPFPDLRLPSLHDGRATSLSEFRGRKLILHVFASW